MFDFLYATYNYTLNYMSRLNVIHVQGAVYETDSPTYVNEYTM